MDRIRYRPVRAGKRSVTYEPLGLDDPFPWKVWKRGHGPTKELSAVASSFDEAIKLANLRAWTDRMMARKRS